MAAKNETAAKSGVGRGGGGTTGKDGKSSEKSNAGRSESKHLNAALGYAKRGWRVFPILGITQLGGCECGNPDCDKAGKHPAIKGWPTEATTDPAQIRQWWAEQPNRGIGIATGEASGITVLDVDGPEGAESLTQLQMKIQGQAGMPDTPMAQSRPGRFHYYFAFEPGIKSNSQKLGAKLDTRNDGGYVVAPPSRHATGGEYKWVSHAELDPAPWPDFLKSGAKAKGKAKAGRPETERFNPANPHDVETLKSALEFIDPDDEERWGQIGWIMGRAFRQSDAGFAEYSAWAGRSRKHNPKRTREHYYEGSKKPAPYYKTTKGIYEWATETGWELPSDGRTAIFLQEGEYSVAVRAAVAVLAAAGGMYSRGGSLVRVVEAHEARALGLRLPGETPDNAIKRDEAQPLLFPIGADYLRVRLDEIARFERGRPVNCPRDIALGVLSLGQWDGIPPLRAITRAPFLRSDGTICDRAGYDAASATFLFPNEALLPVPVNPDRRAALKALAQLREPFDEVPWKEPMHESAFIAFVLTLIARPILPYVPTFIFSAPKAGNGKTLLVDCASLIVHGITPTKRSYPNDADEQRKVLQAVMLAGDAVLLFDNVKEGGSVGGEALNLYVTADAIGDRTLGHSEVRRVINSTCIAFTGNNIGARSDFVRRTLAVQIDAQIEHPEARRFRIPRLASYLRDERARLLCAALTLLRAFVVAGAPAAKREPLGSFEDWDRLVAACLLWLGLPDPVLTKEDLEMEDPDAESAATLFHELEQMNPDGASFTVADVKCRLGSATLAAAISAACGSIDELPYWLRSNKDRIYGGRKLHKEKGTVNGVARWRIQTVG